MLPYERLWRVFWWGVLPFSVFAALFALSHFLPLLLLEAHGALESDALIFFTVGRGILNGLLPYSDLFESKPPGMFLLTVLSLLFTSGDGFYLSLITLFFILLPLLPLLFFWIWWEGEARSPLRYTFAGVSLVLGILFTLYLEDRAGAGQAEFFGSVFGCIYVCNVLVARGRFSAGRTTISTCAILLSIGIKEPFILPLLAVAFLLLPSWNSFFRGFLLPLFFAGGVGVLVLLLLGYLQPYLSVYLPAMLMNRIELNANPLEALWMRGFSVRRVYGNLTLFSPIPLLGYIVGLLLAFSPLYPLQRVRWYDMFVACIAFIAVFFALHFTHVFLLLHDVRYVIHPHLWLYAILTVVVLATVLFYYSYSHRSRFLLIFFPVLYCVSLSVAVGGYLTNHFAFAFPVYFAGLLLFLRYSASPHRSQILCTAVALLTFTALITYRPSSQHLAYVRVMQQHTSPTFHAHAEHLDALLDACGLERYIGEGGYLSGLALAHHSPLGPLLVTSVGDHNYLPRDHPLFHRTFATLMREGNVLVMEEARYRGHPLLPFFVSEFTASPPSCARPYLPFEDFVVLFRRGWGRKA